MLGLVTVSMLIRDVSQYNGHTGPVLLQATASVLTDCWSQALCILAWHQHVLGRQLLLLLKQMCNSGGSINPQLLLRVMAFLHSHCSSAQQMEHQPVPRKRGKRSDHTNSHLPTFSSSEHRKHLLDLALKNVGGYLVQQHHHASSAVFTSLPDRQCS